MKVLIQRVASASVSVDSQTLGSIGRGFLVLLGVGPDDDRAAVERLVRKMINLRIFADENGKTNLSLRDVGGSVLIVSQFTLYADCRHGNRPSFTGSAPADLAKELYEYFILCCQREIPVVEHGSFGAEMRVSLVNDGPFTVMLE